ncbi:hypothetical protein CEXT_587891 [Caerostris extrusa]|uniref:Uncharacterized protein n=1 Tax=Caerostris extrusa TaxID=172846 RepID=A0AAV4NU33_CAEEX|nr:hypothetical protein CEXT_587891 [Caerostris extrusa]
MNKRAIIFCGFGRENEIHNNPNRAKKMILLNFTKSLFSDLQRFACVTIKLQSSLHITGTYSFYIVYLFGSSTSALFLEQNNANSFETAPRRLVDVSESMECCNFPTLHRFETGLVNLSRKSL